MVVSADKGGVDCPRVLEIRAQQNISFNKVLLNLSPNPIPQDYTEELEGWFGFGEKGSASQRGEVTFPLVFLSLHQV